MVEEAGEGLISNRVSGGRLRNATLAAQAFRLGEGHKPAYTCGTLRNLVSSYFIRENLRINACDSKDQLKSGPKECS